VSTGDLPSGSAFSIRLPASWFELDVRPATRDASIATAVTERIAAQPELREHRTALARVLRSQARDAWEAGAVYCACFAMAIEDAVIPGSLTISVIPPPPGGSGIDAIAADLPVREPTDDGEPWRSRRVVRLAGGLSAARSEGVQDVLLPGGSGAVRVVTMQTFLPVDAERVILVAAASPAVDLAEPLLELFDAVTSTFTLVDGSDHLGPIDVGV
jgi:hypothetical protein